MLNPRERRIFEARRLADDPMTLEELSTEFGVSRERVRQIEVRAFEKVQAAVKAGVALAQIPAQSRGAGAARAITSRQTPAGASLVSTARVHQTVTSMGEPEHVRR